MYALPIYQRLLRRTALSCSRVRHGVDLHGTQDGSLVALHAGTAFFQMEKRSPMLLRRTTGCGASGVKTSLALR
ncbi:hypothetical protein XFF6992_210046 [Xanthomonas citri pv. fuscans]|nr:hypothetical protein XFF6992_210046 [Xanthomonas citri pv. fuscans]SOO31427.1 hypothetical protein XFF6994_1360010 [Xanthomonas citri pv. fuscans]